MSGSASKRRFEGILLGLGAAIVLASGPLAIPCESQVQPFVASCKVDDEISPADRDAIDHAALTFVQNALASDPSAAYAAMTEDAKANTPLQQFVSAFQNDIKPMGPFQNMRVAHTYLATVTGGSQQQQVICGDLSSPERWVEVAAKPGPADAHVIVESQTKNNQYDFVMWLMPQRGSWQVQYIQSAIVAMVGKSAEDLGAMAAAEHKQQHDFNAFLLYAAAVQLTNRGPFFQLGIVSDLQKAMGGVPRPRILDGQPPFKWLLDKSTYTVLNVGPIGVGGKIYLMVDHELAPWTNDSEADAKNRELIAAFAKAYPEYKTAFAGIVVRAHERGGNRGFGTVDENK